MKMSNTLTVLDGTPNWIEALCREIDTLKFASAFDTFTTLRRIVAATK
jgi:hypothetical protein